MSIQQYVGRYPVDMWVTDSSGGKPTPSKANKAGDQGKSRPFSLTEKIAVDRKVVERDIEKCMQEGPKAAELRKEAEDCSKRWEIRKKRTLLQEADRIEERAERAASGEDLREFDQSSEKYISNYRKQKFFRKSSQQPQSLLPRNSPSQTPADIIIGNGENIVEFTPESSASENSIISDYMRIRSDASPKYYVDQKDTCRACQAPLQLYMTQSTLVCPKCGLGHPFLDSTAALLAYTDDSYDYCSFSYKRINHFNEWLQQFQGKEGTEIPDSVLQATMQRLWDERVRGPDQITTHRVRDVLKKLKLRRWYEHSVSIACRLTGRMPPRMSPEQEEQCRLMFLAIQHSFETHCPPDRKNFLSYSYVLYKFCQLLNYDHFLPCFNLLKGRDKLMKQDQIFRNICKDLDWTFIPSASAI